MFTLQPSPTFDVVVHIAQPGADPAPLHLVCRHMTRAAVQAWVADAAQTNDAAFLARAVCGWRHVLGPDGAEVPFSPAALAQLLDNYAAAGRAIFDAYLRELAEGRAKN
jgi:hypothetical protein